MKHIVTLVLLAVSLFTVSARAQEQTATVHFDRKIQFIGAVGSPILNCDGVIVGKLHKHEDLTVQMSIGKHLCFIGIFSPTAITVHTGENEFVIGFDMRNVTAVQKE